jgi:4-alpha-glucanotransferase
LPAGTGTGTGLGSLGADARRFIDWIQSAGFRWWQVLPLHPPQVDSPYSSMSVFAGDERLIDVGVLEDWGWLPRDSRPESLQDALELARSLIEKQQGRPWTKYQIFLQKTGSWLDSYALFRVLREEFGGQSWQHWPAELARLFFGARDDVGVPLGMQALLDQRGHSVEMVRFTQFVFFEQWQALLAYARFRNVRVLGDMPLFVDLNSADVWSCPELFDLDSNGQPKTVAGVPPDYFSATGQRWGNPQYRWDRIAADGYRWWIARVSWALEGLDGLRIDHFRGIQAYWSIPAESPTAMEGTWVTGPGEAFFAALQSALGALPLIAEDLGTITPEVEVLRDRFALPGMKILQFAFDGNPHNPYLPEQHVENCVVYTGTHDNDTLCGWFGSLDPELQNRVLQALGEGAEMPDAMIRAALNSPARLAVIPMQDLLGLDHQHRMNTPGTVEGNWSWRFSWDWIPDSRAGELRGWNQFASRLD